MEQSEDMEVDVKTWLRSGTPMSIEEQLVPRGILPAVDERAPEDARRLLELLPGGL